MPAYRRVEVHTKSRDFRAATHIVTEPELPKPAPGHIVVKNHYVGINATDINITNGAYSPAPAPFGCGLDAVGVVVDVGEGVEDVKLDDAVIFQGAWSLLVYLKRCVVC